MEITLSTISLRNYSWYIGNDYSTHLNFSLLLQGFETRFILSHAVENGGRFETEQIDQLKRLGGWAVKLQFLHLYLKPIVEEYSDTCGLLTTVGLNAWKQTDWCASAPQALNSNTERIVLQILRLTIERKFANW